MLNTLLRISGVYRVYEKYLRSQISDGEVPQHVGIILDGNRRWARSKSYPEWLGHHAGAKSAEHVLDWCLRLGIKTLTLYVLSTENLQRPPHEVNELVDLIGEKLTELMNDERIHRHRVAVRAIGDKRLLPERIVDLLDRLEEITRDYDQHYLNIAIAYGGRAEIVEAVRRIVEKVKQGEVGVEDIDSKAIERHLYTSHLSNPEPDLIIRTSGEERLSGFLLWQSAYSELVFLDVYWPSFRRIDLMRAIRTYQQRRRRFGR